MSFYPLRMKTSDVDRYCQTIKLNIEEIKELNINNDAKEALYTLLSGYAEKHDESHAFEFPKIWQTNKELCERINSKVLRMCVIIANADNDDYGILLSLGMIQNIGITCLRHIYGIATCHEIIDNCPFIIVNDKLLRFLSNTFVIIYTHHQEPSDRLVLIQDLTKFMYVCMMIATDENAVHFRAEYPFQDESRQEVYKATVKLLASLV